MRLRIKGFALAIGLASTTLLLPFASAPAHAWCAPDPGFGNGCGNVCPPPIVVKGKEIIRFYCTE